MQSAGPSWSPQYERLGSSPRPCRWCQNFSLKILTLEILTPTSSGSGTLSRSQVPGVTPMGNPLYSYRSKENVAMRTSEFTPSDHSVADFDGMNDYLTQPMSVVRCATMTTDEKRSMLASWASDERAVLDHPSLRWLDNGCLIEIDEIFAALKQLDQIADHLNPNDLGMRSCRRQHRRTFKRLRKRDRENGDDDPPTPTPATVRPRPPVLDGCAAVAV